LALGCVVNRRDGSAIRQRGAAAGVHVARRGTDVRIGKTVDRLHQEVDQATLPLQERQQLERGAIRDVWFRLGRLRAGGKRGNKGLAVADAARERAVAQRTKETTERERNAREETELCGGHAPVIASASRDGIEKVELTGRRAKA
jgi:hypothetical protein